MTEVKTPAEIAAMRESGRMLATVLEKLRVQLEPGMSTKHLADLAANELRSLGGKPAFLGYQGFPDVLCVSVNDEVVHGIPRANRIIQEGDIVSMDFGVIYKDMITDGAISTIAGRSKNPQYQQLVFATEESLKAGIVAVHDGVRTGDIGAAVQAVLDAHKYGIVRDLVGHGVGHQLHEEPNVPNYGKKGTGTQLQAGMTIAIEPMATLGTHEVLMAQDGWTILTADGSMAAHFEHTILITADGAEILTTTA
ncbi:MAG: type I methionyl aminopeptidase [Candidatus Saccharimonadales bacterium]